jgi:NADH-quinone oxidoreductase subunit G
VRNNEILRQTPRYNTAVNDHWMCDYGRLQTFPPVNSDSRIRCPLSRREGELVEVSWDEAIARAASEFPSFRKNEVGVIASPCATNEDLYLLQKFARDVLGTKYVATVPHLVPGDEDELLIHPDKAPNTRGLLSLGLVESYDRTALNALVRRIQEGQIRALYVVEENVSAIAEVAGVMGKLDFIVVHASTENETTRQADLVFAASTFAERNGTYTNFQGRVQRIRPSVATLDSDRSLEGFAMSRLDRAGTTFDRWGKGQRREARPTWKIIAGIASVMGFKYKYQSAEDVFHELASSTAAFRGMEFRSIGTSGALLNSPSESPVRS